MFFASQNASQLKPPRRLIEDSTDNRQVVFAGCHDLNITVQFRPDEFHRAFRNLEPSILTVFTSISAAFRTFDLRRLLRRYNVATTTNAGLAKFSASHEGCDSDFFLSSGVADVDAARNENTSTSSSSVKTSPIDSRLN